MIVTIMLAIGPLAGALVGAWIATACRTGRPLLKWPGKMEAHDAPTDVTANPRKREES